jgi:hypothetical protein
VPVTRPTRQDLRVHFNPSHGMIRLVALRLTYLVISKLPSWSAARGRRVSEGRRDTLLRHQLPLLHRKTPRPPLSRRTRALIAASSADSPATTTGSSRSPDPTQSCTGTDNSSPVTGPPTTSRDDHPPAPA